MARSAEENCSKECSWALLELQKHSQTSLCLIQSGIKTFCYPFVNILKTTPTPNRNGSYGIKVGFIWHKSRSSYAITVGSDTIFSVKVPGFQGIFAAYDPSFYGIFWEHIFLLIWGMEVDEIVFSLGFLQSGHFQPQAARHSCFKWPAGSQPKRAFFGEETKGRFCKRVLLANVPSFRFLEPSLRFLYPRSGFGGSVVPVFVPSFRVFEHPPKPPFWKPPLYEPPILVHRSQFERCTMR